MDINIIKYLIIFFMVGVISDIVLNDMSKHLLPSLIPYFKDKYILQSGAYAGLTILSALIPLLFINKIIFKTYIPTSLSHIGIFLLISFIVGYIYDIIIDKMHIFGPSLDPYYVQYGSGLYGALSLIFAIVVTYGVYLYFIPK